MKKIFCFLFLLIIANLAAIAQQDPQFSFNKLTQLTVNPGFAGKDDGVSGTILNRNQWQGFDGAPRTKVFTISSQTRLFGAPAGIGLNIMSDKLGFLKTINVSFDYSYRTPISLGELGIGVSGGFLNRTYDGKWEAPDNVGSSDYWSTTDNLLPEDELKQMAFDVGFGVYLHSKDYYIGASVSHINQAEFKNQDGQVFDFLARHYYLTGGYNIEMSDPLFVLQPSVFIKTDMRALQADIDLELTYNNRITGGLGYRLNDAVIVLFSYELANGLKAGYAFDLVTSAIGRYGYGSHEVYISYNFDLGKGRLKKYKSVRFL